MPTVIDLTALLSGEVNRIEFAFGLDVSMLSDDFVNAYADIKGDIVNHSGYIELNANLIIDAIVYCARCAKQFPNRIPLSIKQPITDSLESDENDDYVFTTEGKLDLDSLFSDSILLELPTRFLCTDDCKGLCPICGIDKNIESCSCNTSMPDLRLEKLKDYLKKN